MKKTIFLISIVAAIYLFGCNHAAKQNHEHSEANHVHEQIDTTHTHEAEDHQHDRAEIQILTLKKQEFRDILKTTGVIIPARENIQSYQAQSSGFIHFVNNNLVQGSSVKKGDILFEIRGGILDGYNGQQG